MVLVMFFPTVNVLYFYLSTLRSMCAVHNMAILYGSLISYLPGMLLRYFLNDFVMVPVAPVITFMTLVFTFRMRCTLLLLLLLLLLFDDTVIAEVGVYYPDSRLCMTGKMKENINCTKTLSTNRAT